MTSDPPANAQDESSGFDSARHELLVALGQALLEQSTGGTVALELAVTQRSQGQDVDLDIRLDLERQSGLSVPATASDAAINLIKQLVVLWREYDREPWRSFTYRLTRGPTGPRFTSEFE
jgi:hypothetical protein